MEKLMDLIDSILENQEKLSDNQKNFVEIIQMLNQRITELEKQVGREHVN